MSRTHKHIMIVAAVVLVALALAVALAACGGDKYSGTWTADFQGEKVTFKIEKSGDKWKVSDPTSQDGQVVEGTEENGKLTLKNPDKPTETMTLERKGDKLVMALGSVSIEFTKQ